MYYEYQNRDGYPVMRIGRKPGGRKGKYFWTQSYVDGRWEVGGPEGRCPVYHLPAVLEAVNGGQTIYVVEGEKKAELLTSHGLTATCNPFGAGHWRPNHTDDLKGAVEVVILPDNDAPGRDHAEKVARSLSGKVDSIKVVSLPGLSEKEDVVEWLGAGHDVEELLHLVQEASPWAGAPAQEEQHDLAEVIENNALSLPGLVGLDLPTPKRIVAPWLRESTLGMIYADAGVGKTWLACILATSLTHSRWDDVKIGPWDIKEPTGVLLVDGEMGVHDLRTNLLRLAHPLGEQIRPLTVLSSDFCRRKGVPRPNLADRKWREALLNHLIGHPEYRVLILDNSASLAPNIDEIKKQDWDPINQWLLDLRFQGVAVLLLHHTNRDSGYRGTSARVDNLDVTIELTRPKGWTPLDGARFRVKIVKGRHIQPGDHASPFVLKITEYRDADGNFLDVPALQVGGVTPRALTWTPEKEEKSPTSKENDNREHDIAALALDGKWNGKRIAQGFGINESRVSQIKGKVIRALELNDPQRKQTFIATRDLEKHFYTKTA